MMNQGFPVLSTNVDLHLTPSPYISSPAGFMLNIFIHLESVWLSLCQVKTNSIFIPFYFHIFFHKIKFIRKSSCLLNLTQLLFYFKMSWTLISCTISLQGNLHCDWLKWVKIHVEVWINILHCKATYHIYSYWMKVQGDCNSLKLCS